MQVITATVPPSGSIEMRAEELVKDIDEGAQGKAVNIIAYVFSTLIGSRVAFKLTNVQT